MEAIRVPFAWRFAIVLAVACCLVPAQNMQAQSFHVVHNFTGGADGAGALNGLMMGAGGYMYGTASSGGAYHNGTIFRINALGSFQTVYAFHGSDGASPQGFLIQDSAGHLYGTTAYGVRSAAEPFFASSTTPRPSFTTSEEVTMAPCL